MYSGFVTSRHTANWLGAHQKFNRMAYGQIEPHVHLVDFPPLDRIQHFEGYNGPDGIKLKSIHRHDEPSHFYDPEQETGPLLEHIYNHSECLQKALREGNVTRAAFEAAWLSHTVTDGLTPAHHYPYEQELHKMYQEGGQEFARRHNKIIIQNHRKRHALKQNWQLWGSKGLLSTHIYFELGVATSVISGRFREHVSPERLRLARKQGPVDYFKTEAAQIHRLRMYEEFQKTSWTASLGRTVRRQLAPTIIQTVAIEWILAAEAVGLGKGK